MDSLPVEPQGNYQYINNIKNESNTHSNLITSSLLYYIFTVVSISCISLGKIPNGEVMVCCCFPSQFSSLSEIAAGTLTSAMVGVCNIYKTPESFAQRGSCCTFSNTPLPVALNRGIWLCSSMLLTAKSASLIQKTFSGRSFIHAQVHWSQELIPPGAAFTVHDENQCINIPAPFTLKGDNFEASVLYCFPKFSHKIKCQLPTMVSYFILCFLLPSLPLSLLFTSVSLPCLRATLRELCRRKGSSAVWKVEAYWRTLG